MNCFSYSENKQFFQVFNQRNRKKTQKQKGTKSCFNLLIPHRLYVQLKNYVELCANKGELMTQTILTSLEKELKERYARKNPS